MIPSQYSPNAPWTRTVRSEKKYIILLVSNTGSLTVINCNDENIKNEPLYNLNKSSGRVYYDFISDISFYDAYHTEHKDLIKIEKKFIL